MSFAGIRSNVDRSRVRRRLGYGRGAGNDGQPDEVLERIRGQAESGEVRRDDVQRRAARTGTSQACQGCFQHLREVDAHERWLEHGAHGDAGWARCAYQVAGDGCESGSAWLARTR